MIITADHGNAEQMIDPVTGGPHTAHTTNPVPFILLSEDCEDNRACDPTVRCAISRRPCLAMLEIGLPKQMTGGDMRQKLTV